MLKTFAKPAALILALTAGVVAAVPAQAGGRGKEFYSQTYVLDRPMHGSYVRIPVHKMINGRMKVVAWTLEQHCY
jgi:hypothetical protein